MKFKSYAFWTSLAAAMVVLIGVFASIFGFEADEKLVTDLIMAICGVLVVLGIVKMPSKEEPEMPDEETHEETTDSNNKSEK